jgi:RimJ/RimL family protein N-acetyltransferase
MLQTPRLRLRELTAEDAPFTLRLLNEPSFIANIADRGVRTLEDAVRYLDRGPIASYALHGFGMWLVEIADTGEAAGMCGLVRREGLADVDIGYAFVPEHWGRGLAREAARAVLAHARDALGLKRLVAIVNLGNARSARLLESLAFADRGTIELGGETLRLFALALQAD